MTEHEGGIAITRKSERALERDEVSEESGAVRETGETILPVDQDPGRASSADDSAAIDLDTARDRAS